MWKEVGVARGTKRISRPPAAPPQNRGSPHRSCPPRHHNFRTASIGTRPLAAAFCPQCDKFSPRRFSFASDFPTRF
jgi:hypothetical protein